MQFSRTTRSKSSHAHRGSKANGRSTARGGPRQAGLFDLLESASSPPAGSSPTAGSRGGSPGGAPAGAGTVTDGPSLGTPIELGALSLRELQLGIVGHRGQTRRTRGEHGRMPRARTSRDDGGVETPMKLQGAGGPQSGQAPEAPEAPDSAEPIVVCLGDVIGVLGVAIAMACCVMAAVFA